MPSEVPADAADEERFALLAFRHLEGHATAEEQAELALRLRQDPTRLAQFAGIARQHGLLGELLAVPPGEAPSMSAEPPIGGATQALRARGSSRRVRRRRRVSGGSMWWSAAAAALVLVVGGLVWSQPRDGGIGRLEHDGTARLERDGRVVADRSLHAGDRVVADGGATVLLGDGSRIVLRGGTRLHLATASRIDIAAGGVQVQATSRPRGPALVLASEVAEARVLGTGFSFSVAASSTRLDVDEGLVRFVRLSDGAALEVGAGAWAEVAAGVPFALQRHAQPAPAVPSFVCGINFNGGAVTIGGHGWWSQEQALAKGLILPVGVAPTATAIAPVPAVERAIAGMLNTAIYVVDAPLPISLPLADGRYVVELWLMENYAAGHRSLTIALEGRTVATRVQAGDPLGSWHRLFYEAEVGDGRLDLVVGGPGENPHVMGLVVTRR